MWDYGSKMSFKVRKKGIFPTVVVFPNQSFTSHTVFCNVVRHEAQVSRTDADAPSSHLFLIRLSRV